MKTALKHYCSFRMVEEYSDVYYQPAAAHMDILLKDDLKEAKYLSGLHRRLMEHWKGIHISQPEYESESVYRVGDSFSVRSEIFLGELKPEDVSVELYYGNVKLADRLSAGETETMKMVEDRGNGIYVYECRLRCSGPGRFGFTVRVRPEKDEWIRMTPDLIKWA